MLRKLLFSLFTLTALLAPASALLAQGLLWSIPEEEGSFVRYFGDLKQIQERPDSARGPLELTWQSELTIKALGSEEGNYKGKTCRCRWLEFKNVVGHQSATGIDAGPYGIRLYKVLVPEEAVIGKPIDDRNIPVIMVPILKGYQKSGNKPVQPVKEKVLTFYPMLGLFTYYPSLKPVGEAEETLSLPQLGDVTTRHYSGTDTLQSMTSRSINEGEIWISSEIPFGWAGYSAKVTREQKDRLAPVDAFKKHSEMQITMSAVEKGTGARSELNVAEDGTVTVEESTLPEAPVAEEAPGAEDKPGKPPAEDNPFEDKPTTDENKPQENPLSDDKPAGDESPSENPPPPTEEPVSGESPSEEPQKPSENAPSSENSPSNEPATSESTEASE